VYFTSLSQAPLLNITSKELVPDGTVTVSLLEAP
tara:strand:- start:107 stop:208 length:102 start_codon:yes stop_codon:yes gene_type:complete